MIQAAIPQSAAATRNESCPCALGNRAWRRPAVPHRAQGDAVPTRRPSTCSAAPGESCSRRRWDSRRRTDSDDTCARRSCAGLCQLCLAVAPGVAPVEGIARKEARTKSGISARSDPPWATANLCRRRPSPASGLRTLLGDASRRQPSWRGRPSQHWRPRASPGSPGC